MPKTQYYLVIRAPCIGGCGTEVLGRGQECRKCRRKRIKIGVRKIHKLWQAERVAKYRAKENKSHKEKNET